MPKKPVYTELTTEQIAFCAKYAKEGNATQSYLEAFNLTADLSNPRENTRIYQRVSKLLSKPQVLQKINEFKQHAVRRGNYTMEKLVQELDEIKKMAVSDGKYGDAVRAVELIGKTMSAFVERTENVNTNNNMNVEISPEEEAQLDSDLRRLRELHEQPTKH